MLVRSSSCSGFAAFIILRNTKTCHKCVIVVIVKCVFTFAFFFIFCTHWDYLVSCLQVTMPRSVKSRKVKGHPVPVPTPSIPVQLDVIRGPLFMPQWCKLVAQEQGEEVVVAILDEVINNVTEKCYKMQQERQVRNILCMCSGVLLMC